VKRVLLSLLAVLMLLPVAIGVMQDDAPPPVTIDVTGIDRSDFPEVVVTANVFDAFNQAVLGLTEPNFAVVGQLTDRMRVVRVENVSDDNLVFSAVLAIDVSGSMIGTPIERAKEAAISFINAIGPNDPVAIVTFASNERLVQDFTTDKDLLTRVINGLVAGGQTALYDGSVLAVQTANASPVPRRAVIILSDGAEFGGRSSSGRSDASAQAVELGVAVNTIGLGFGTDRTYLQEVATTTGGNFFESPSPDELLEIYNALALRFRSQYFIYLTTDVPGDGSIYQLDLQVTDADGNTAQDRVQMRAPINAPLVSFANLPDAAISEPLIVSAQALADEGVSSATFQFADQEPVPSSFPYEFTVDPATLTPGVYDLVFTAVDASGDERSTTGQIEIAAIPPEVVFSDIEEGQVVDSALDVTATAIQRQSPVTGLIVRLDGNLVLSTRDFSSTFTLDPATLTPGTHVLEASTTDTTGQRAVTTVNFEVPILPPTITVDPLTEGQVISEVTEVTITGASAQAAIQGVTVFVDDAPASSVNGSDSTTITLDPANFAPGSHTLRAVTRDVNGGRAETTINFEVAAIPPTISLAGLENDSTVDDLTVVTAEVTSPQSGITAVNWTLNGQPITGSAEAPYTVDVDPSLLSPGIYVLRGVVVNEAGLTAEDTVTFRIPRNMPTATPTFTPSPVPPTAVPTNTAVPPTAAPTNTPRPTDVPPTNTAVPPTAAPTNTRVPPTATATDVPASSTPRPTRVPATATLTEVPATDVPASSTPRPTRVPATATATEVPPSSTPRPTRVPATATATEVPPTNTPRPTRVPATATATEVPPTEGVTAVAQVPTSTPRATNTPRPSATPVPTEVPATNTPRPSATPVPATATDVPASSTPRPTSTVRPSATPVPATDVPTDAPTDEPTAAPTRAASSTPVPTDEATEEATAAAQVAASNTPVPTLAASATPAGTPTIVPTLTVETQQPAAPAQSPLLIGMTCLLGLLLLGVIYWVAARRRERDNNQRR
jgi:VWFA-related protein